MTLKDYIADKMPFLITNVILFAAVSGILLLLNMSGAIVFLIFIVWFTPVVTYILVEFIRMGMFHKELSGTLESLDQKYLVAEIMKEPGSAEGRLLYKVLQESNRNMHEHVKSYRERENEYREYIETWVHEIKTPIASTRLIIENNPNQVTRNIQEEVRKIEEYIEQVLYYSRSNNVSRDYQIREVPLPALVRNVVKRNSRDFISRGIAVEIDAVEGVVYSDAKWLEFILNQLIGNALKYTEGPDGKVEIRAARNENNLVLSITDNGIGIGDKDRDRVFEKGFTGENGRKFGASTGIGLYLCKKLADQLGLGITLSSEAGAGTTVSLVFPLGKAA